MKHEWKKAEKALYLPKPKPEIVTVPAFNFFSINGQGNPNDPAFAEYIGVLYSLSYAIRMSHKGDHAPEGYFEYTVYPLEGVWDITDEAKKVYDGSLDKDSLVFTLMIRQPDFVTAAYAAETISRVQAMKPHDLLSEVEFGSIEEGVSVQMMHLGSFDNEPESFRKMEAFATEQGLRRKSLIHREIYLSDVRRVAPEKLKTVLRFGVKE